MTQDHVAAFLFIAMNDSATAVSFRANVAISHNLGEKGVLHKTWKIVEPRSNFALQAFYATT